MKKIIVLAALALALVAGTAPIAFACGGTNCATADGGGCNGC
jgi:hypothetical protein